MTALSTLRTDLRNRLIETTAEFFTNAELLIYLNLAYREFCRKTEYIERVKAYPLVANQYDYALPSNIIKVSGLWWKDQYKLRPRDMEEFAREVGSGWPTAFTPESGAYRLYPHATKFRLNGVPSAASDSSTINGSHNTSVTTIAITSATNFDSRGYAIINGSEQIQYLAKSGNNLTQVIRGDGGSTAASYTNEAISEAPLLLYYTCIPADLSGDSDTVEIPDYYDGCLVEYALAMALDKAGKLDAAKYHMSRAEKTMKEAMEERDKMQRDKYFNIKDEDYGNYWFN